MSTIKRYTIELIHDNGQFHLKRTCEGFAAHELLGLLYATQTDILKQIAGEQKIDTVERKVIAETTIEKDALIRRNMLIPIRDIATVRCINICKRAGLYTLGDVASLNDLSELMKIRSMGKKTLAELEQLLSDHQLSFGMDVTKYKAV